MDAHCSMMAWLQEMLQAPGLQLPAVAHLCYRFKGHSLGMVRVSVVPGSEPGTFKFDGMPRALKDFATRHNLASFATWEQHKMAMAMTQVLPDAMDTVLVQQLEYILTGSPTPESKRRCLSLESTGTQQQLMPPPYAPAPPPASPYQGPVAPPPGVPFRRASKWGGEQQLQEKIREQDSEIARLQSELEASMARESRCTGDLQYSKLETARYKHEAEYSDGKARKLQEKINAQAGVAARLQAEQLQLQLRIDAHAEAAERREVEKQQLQAQLDAAALREAELLQLQESTLAEVAALHEVELQSLEKDMRAHFETLREDMRKQCERQALAEESMALREAGVVRALNDHLAREAALAKREAAWGMMPVEQRAFAVPAPDDGQKLWDMEANVTVRDRARDWVQLRDSTIRGAGRGVFALHDLKKGQLITRVNGTVMPLAEAAAMPFSRYQVEAVMTLRNKRMAWAVRLEEPELSGERDSFTEGLGMFVNSADFTEVKRMAGGNVGYRIVCPAPNCKRAMEGRALKYAPAFYVEATRDIHAGEELLVCTYGQKYWESLALASRDAEAEAEVEAET